jgi:hypothetical protein
VWSVAVSQMVLTSSSSGVSGPGTWDKVAGASRKVMQLRQLQGVFVGGRLVHGIGHGFGRWRDVQPHFYAFERHEFGVGFG